MNELIFFCFLKSSHHSVFDFFPPPTSPPHPYYTQMWGVALMTEEGKNQQLCFIWNIHMYLNFPFFLFYLMGDTLNVSFCSMFFWVFFFIEILREHSNLYSLLVWKQKRKWKSLWYIMFIKIPTEFCLFVIPWIQTNKLK